MYREGTQGPGWVWRRSQERGVCGAEGCRGTGLPPFCVTTHTFFFKKQGAFHICRP